MSRITMLVRHFVKNDDAATMVEYAIMLALIAAVCIVVIGPLGTAVSTTCSNITPQLPG